MKITVVRKITHVKTYSKVIDYNPIDRNAYYLDEDLPRTSQSIVDDTTEFFDDNGQSVDLIRLEEIYHDEL